MLFNTAHDNKTITQIVLKATFLHRRLGISAGLPNLSWRSIQKTKATIVTVAIQRSAIFGAFRMFASLAVIILYTEPLLVMSDHGQLRTFIWVNIRKDVGEKPKASTRQYHSGPVDLVSQRVT